MGEKKHNHKSQLRSITPYDRLSMAIFKKHQWCWVSCDRDHMSHKAWNSYYLSLGGKCLPIRGPELALKQPWFGAGSTLCCITAPRDRDLHILPLLLKSQNHFIFTKDWTSVMVTPRFLGVVTSKFFPTQLLSRNRDMQQEPSVFSAELDSYGPPALPLWGHCVPVPAHQVSSKAEKEDASRSSRPLHLLLLPTCLRQRRDDEKWWKCLGKRR